MDIVFSFNVILPYLLEFAEGTNGKGLLFGLPMFVMLCYFIRGEFNRG